MDACQVVLFVCIYVHTIFSPVLYIISSMIEVLVTLPRNGKGPEKMMMMMMMTAKYYVVDVRSRPVQSRSRRYADDMTCTSAVQ